MTGSKFNVTNKIVVDVNVPFHVIIHRVFLADLHLLDQPYECRAVKFLQLRVILHHVAKVGTPFFSFERVPNPCKMYLQHTIYNCLILFAIAIIIIM